VAHLQHRNLDFFHFWHICTLAHLTTLNAFPLANLFILLHLITPRQAVRKMAAAQQQPMQPAPPNQPFEAISLRDLKENPGRVDCPICYQRVRTQAIPEKEPMTSSASLKPSPSHELMNWRSGEVLKAVCIGFCGFTTVRKKWIEHYCPNCRELLVKYHPLMQPSTHGPVRSGLGETEVCYRGFLTH